jgi:arylsulfatase A-like enzyme
MPSRFALLIAVLFALPAAAADQPDRPNIVFILADDLGYTDVACFGSKYYETPNIDRLASQGLKYTHGYTCGPNCQPTRAALMTGQYGPRTGIYTVGGTDRFDSTSRPLVPVPNVTELDPAKVTVAESLKKAGYTTGMFGKWHLGGNNGGHDPGHQGFDEAIVSMGQHFDFNTQPKVDYPKGTYLADFLTEKALGFIEKNKAKPFFLYLPHFGVHSPHQAKEDLIARFKDKPPVGGHHSPVYAAMIASVDESVGKVVAKIDELGLGKNTLIIFSSDNGGVGGYARAGVIKNKAEDITDNAPLRGGKGMLYEGGTRVPWIARWTGVIKPGTVSTTPILSVDLHPTLLELTGAPKPENQPLDGLSLVASLKSSGQKSLGREDLFWHFPGYLGAGTNSWRTTPAGAIRHNDYKLIEFFETGTIELYDVVKDVSQEHDLAKEKPEVVKDLYARLVAWRESVKAPMPEKRDGSSAAETPKKKKMGKKAKQAAEKNSCS